MSQGRKPLLPVRDALERLLVGVTARETEMVPLAEASDRVLAEDLIALRTQPPFPASSMDGYAVRSADCAAAGVSLNLIGEAAAGHPFAGSVGVGECVRIFTGAPVPEGANAVLIQENAEPDSQRVKVLSSVTQGENVRRAGIDFTRGEVLVRAGTRMDPGALCLAAAANHPFLPVVRKPRVGILATGDELLQPGTEPGPGQIIASNSFGVAAICRQNGADVIDLGIARDTRESLEAALQTALETNCDLLITLGGASVGEHDLVRDVFGAAGMSLDFWKIAMRPGKPLMAGSLGDMRILGLPGNPVSSMVCSVLFAAPLVSVMAGRKYDDMRTKVTLAHDLAPNGDREHYMRAVVTPEGNGNLSADIFENQDSSLMGIFARANALVIRPAHDQARKAGEKLDAIMLRPL